MKSRTRTAAQLSKFLLLALFLTLTPAALAKSTWYVDGVNGNDSNDCLSSQTACQTIGHAISLASSGDSIMVAPAIYTENLNIGISLKVIGSDAATTIVDGNQAGTVFTISNPQARVYLSKLTIRNGRAENGGGISNRSTLTINRSTITGNEAIHWAGGIDNTSTLTINRSTITGNKAIDDAGGIQSAGTLTINRSTVAGNVCTNPVDGDGFGGGIYLFGTATINNSTISGNRASQLAGAIFSDGGTATINNSTISRNSAGLYWGGGIAVGHGGSMILQNTVVANNPPGNCHKYDGTFIISNGYNLSSDDTCNFNGTGDMNNTDAKLGKLRDNGGPTQTMRLLPGSPAIDAGNPNGCTDEKGNLLKTDQRGRLRPGKYDAGGCDIGAFERQHD